MKVRELIEQLSHADPEADVVLQSDPEGNSFETCEGVDVTKQIYIIDRTGIDVYRTELTDGMKAAGYEEEDVRDASEGEACIVIYP